MKTRLFCHAVAVLIAAALLVLTSIGAADATISPAATGGGCRHSGGVESCIGADSTGSVYATGTYPKTSKPCTAQIQIVKQSSSQTWFYKQKDCGAGLIGVDTPSGQHGSYYALVTYRLLCSSCSDLDVASPWISG